MGGPFSTNKAPELKTVHRKVLVVGGCSSGKSSIIRRYIANQFIVPSNEEEPLERQTKAGPQKLPEYFTHTLKVPGRREVVSVTFREVPSHPLPYMKEQYYTDADAIIIVITGSQYQESNDSSSDLEVAEDRSEITMREAQTWKTDILANSHYTPQDLPMMVLVNERETETECREQINGKDEKLDQEQLSELAIKNGFTSCLRVCPHLGDGSVLRAVDSLLRLLLEKNSINQKLATVKSYPTQAQVPL